jgi:hypothetical protein
MNENWFLNFSFSFQLCGSLLRAVESIYRDRSVVRDINKPSIVLVLWNCRLPLYTQTKFKKKINHYIPSNCCDLNLSQALRLWLYSDIFDQQLTLKGQPVLLFLNNVLSKEVKNYPMMTQRSSLQISVFSPWNHYTASNFCGVNLPQTLRLWLQSDILDQPLTLKEWTPGSFLSNREVKY